MMLRCLIYSEQNLDNICGRIAVYELFSVTSSSETHTQHRLFCHADGYYWP